MSHSDNASPFAAEIYDASVRQTIAFYETIHAETLDLVRTLKPDVIQWLDTGCGTGYLIEMALPVFPNTQFVLTDPAEPMLKRAEDRLKGAPGNRVRFLPPTPTEGLLSHRDALKPQVITAVLCHHYLSKETRQMATDVCHQLLAPGGIFVLVENIAPISLQGIRLGLERWKRFQLEHGQPPSKAEEHAKRFNTHYFPITLTAHIALLKETGFQTVELFWNSHMQAGFYAIK